MTDTERYTLLTTHEDLQAKLVVLTITLKEQAEILQEIIVQVKAMAALLRQEGD